MSDHEKEVRRVLGLNGEKYDYVLAHISPKMLQKLMKPRGGKKVNKRSKN